MTNLFKIIYPRNSSIYALLKKIIFSSVFLKMSIKDFSGTLKELNYITQAIRSHSLLKDFEMTITETGDDNCRDKHLQIDKSSKKYR